MPTLLGGCLSGLSAAFKRPPNRKADERTRLMLTSVGGRPDDAAKLRPDRGDAANASGGRSNATSRLRKADTFKVISVRCESPCVDDIQRPECSLRLHVEARGLELSSDAKPPGAPPLATWPYERVALYGWSRDSFRLVIEGGGAAATATATASHLTFFTAPGVGRAIFSAVQRHDAENRRLAATAGPAPTDRT